MKKIIKLLIFSIIILFSINISSTSAASYKSLQIYNEHGGWGSELSRIAKNYIGNKSKNQINLNGLRYALAERVCGVGAGGCTNIHTYVSQRGGNLARWIGSDLHIGCGNGLLARFIFCTPNNTPPSISADKSKSERQKYIGDITLTTNATEYSKYIWDSDTCVSNGESFSNGKITQIPGEGKHKLYLCAKSRPRNECSSSTTKSVALDYWYDPEKSSCDNSSLPTNFSNFKIISSKAISSEVYSYNGSLCGYICEDGYKLDNKGTEDNSDDVCVYDIINKCNINTKPTNNNNMVFVGVDGGSIVYTSNGDKCSYSCDIGYVLDDNNTPNNYTDDKCIENINPNDFCNSNTKPSDSNMIFKGENDSTTGTIDYSYNSEKCGYVCKELTWNQNGTEDPSDDTCSTTPSECSEPGKPNAFTESTMSYNSQTCTYNCKVDGYIYNTHQTNDTLDDTCDAKIPVGGNSLGTKPTNTNNMILTSTGDVIQSNQAYIYKCDTNYILNNNGTTDIIDDYCEFDISTCKSGVITKECSCDLDMNKNLSVCTPATLPGDNRNPGGDEIPGTLPGEIGIMDKDLLANNYTYRISIPVGEDESSISYFTYKIEQLDGTMSEEKTSQPGLKFSWNMTDVDSDRKADGSREYTFHLIKVCDSADNCKQVNKDYIHKVYANTISFNTVNKTFNTNGIADGTSKSSKITLKGKYGNQVVPASGINRTIDFNFDATNTVYQDQYTNSRNAVYVTEANRNNYANRISLGTNLNQFNHQNSTNGTYDFKFKFYAPTINNHEFKLNNLSVDINGKIGNIQNYSLTTSKIYNFTPLYDVEFSNNFNNLKSQHTQSGTINLKRDYSSSKNLYLSNSDNIVLEEGGIKKYSFELKYNINGNNLDSLFSFVGLENSYLSDFESIYIQSWIRYKNDGKNIRYKSTNIGGNNEIINRLKINGNSNIDKNKQRDALEGQGDKDIHNLSGKIDKAILKRNIKRNAFKLTRGMTSGTELNGIKYFQCTSGQIKEFSNNYNGTYILKGCNAYIKNNVSIGGIIILKNSNGNGGKLYIDPSVTKIQAAIYTDKSIFSYDGNNELTSTTNYKILKNQLYIYGVVFSENTIGGSLKSPSICPYYVSTCTREEAQKYDLNFLRSGFENKSNSNLGDYPVIITYNPSVQTNPPKGFSE